MADNDRELLIRIDERVVTIFNQMEDMEKLFPSEFIERYKKIVLERFPNHEDNTLGKF